MSEKTEKEFADIADEVIEQAEGVKCSFSEFVSGMEIIYEQVRDRLQMARGELAEKEGEEEDEDGDDDSPFELGDEPE